MEDEPWVIEDPSEAEAAAAEAVVAPDAAPAAVEEGAAAEPVKETLDKTKLIFKHWVRPKFLQYNYLYDYRHNYYDDVIDFLDRRNSGSAAEAPRAQTWGERALRTYVSRPNRSLADLASRQDSRLLAHISAGARFHRYHSKSLISRKYSSLGFGVVNVIV